MCVQMVFVWCVYLLRAICVHGGKITDLDKIIQEEAIQLLKEHLNAHSDYSTK